MLVHYSYEGGGHCLARLGDALTKLEKYRTVFMVKPGQPVSSLLFTGAMAAVAIGTLWYLGSQRESASIPWPAVVYLGILSTLCELMPVSLPRTGKVSVGFAVNFAAILLFGPLEACVVAGMGMMVGGLLRALPFDYWVFNTSQMIVVASSAAHVFLAMGGQPSQFENLWQQTPAYLVTALVYWLVNATLFITVVSLEERTSFWRMWTANIKWAVSNYLALGCLGLLGAVAYKSPLGAVGLLILFIPLLIARYGFQRFMDVRAAHLETVRALAAALDAKDPYTRGHSDRVADLAVALARELKLPEDQVETIHHAAILHDVGKISIHDSLLNKPGQLDPEDYKVLQTHATIGADIVGRSIFFREVSNIVRHHHEWYDGRGYPDGLRGEQIPIGGRIVGVADAYDAMTSDRSYRKAFTPEEAVERIVAARGVQFDPNVVDALIRHLTKKGIIHAR